MIADQVLRLLGAAKETVLIVAPFIRSVALSKLLEAIPPEPNTTIVTRWRPLDILAGASDLDVYDLATGKPATLLLRNDLHAKLFAADNHCLVGSANVTNLALGWHTPPNLELLIPALRTQPEIADFEAHLLSGCVTATARHRDSVESVLRDLKATQQAPPPTHLDEHYGAPAWNWLPRTRTPEDLYAVYSGQIEYTRHMLLAMQEDIRQLGPPPGLDNAQFSNWIATAISQTPLVSWVLGEIDHTGSVTEAQLEKKLTDLHLDVDPNPREVLETLRRWMTHFFTADYQTAADSLKLIRATSL